MRDGDVSGPLLALTLERDVDPYLAQRGRDPPQSLRQVGWPLGPAFCLLLGLGNDIVEGFQQLGCSALELGCPVHIAAQDSGDLVGFEHCLDRLGDIGGVGGYECAVLPERALARAHPDREVSHTWFAI
jgi:hypothetical protein